MMKNYIVLCARQVRCLFLYFDDFAQESLKVAGVI